MKIYKKIFILLSIVSVFFLKPLQAASSAPAINQEVLQTPLTVEKIQLWNTQNTTEFFSLYEQLVELKKTNPKNKFLHGHLNGLKQLLNLKHLKINDIQSSEDKECICCYDAQKTFVYAPCQNKHNEYICHKCIQKILTSTDEEGTSTSVCPICRAPFTEKFEYFYNSVLDDEEAALDNTFDVNLLSLLMYHTEYADSILTNQQKAKLLFKLLKTSNHNSIKYLQMYVNPNSLLQLPGEKICTFLEAVYTRKAGKEYVLTYFLNHPGLNEKTINNKTFLQTVLKEKDLKTLSTVISHPLFKVTEKFLTQAKAKLSPSVSEEKIILNKIQANFDLQNKTDWWED